jgi:hypothetical protein
MGCVGVAVVQRHRAVEGCPDRRILSQTGADLSWPLLFRDQQQLSEVLNSQLDSERNSKHMSHSTIKVTLSLVALATATLATQAQTAASPAKAPPPPSAWDQWAKQAKNPTDWLTWGADVRVRDEYLPNAISLSDADPLSEQNVIRFRARVWASVTPVTNLSVNARLSAEPRLFTEPASYGQRGGSSSITGRGGSGMDWRYGILDNANLKWANAFDQPLTFTVGRQDILLGDFYDWWLVADGTPGDGSWTFFLDSARLAYEAKEIKTRFDLIYIYQSPLPDDWMPTIGDAHYSDAPKFPGTDHPLTEQRESGVVVYVSNKSVKNTTIDGYFIYKHDDQVTFTRRDADWIPGDNADIYTFGGKITGTPAEHWQYSLEGAYQFGWKEDNLFFYDPADRLAKRDISAYGGKAKLTYLCQDKLNNQFFLAGEYLSGDDPKTTDKDEMFDLLWGRWPRWSELYIYSYAQETSGKIAQINNLVRFGPGWTCSPMKGMTFSAAYNALFAPEDTPTRRVPPAAGLFSNDGNFRGHYLQTVLKHQFNKNWSAHLWAEFVWEGDYYAQRDTMMFLRPEIMFTF